MATPSTPTLSSTGSSSVPHVIPRKCKTRRGKRNSQKCLNKYDSIKNCQTWKIFQSNIRGYNSKKISLKNILCSINPNVITLNEVGFRGKKKCSIEGYNTYTRNRQTQSMGGISTSIRKDESQFCLKVEEGEDQDEFIIIRQDQFLRLINICNVCGEQEGRNRNRGKMGKNMQSFKSN